MCVCACVCVRACVCACAECRKIESVVQYLSPSSFSYGHDGLDTAAYDFRTGAVSNSKILKTIEHFFVPWCIQQIVLS